MFLLARNNRTQLLLDLLEPILQNKDKVVITAESLTVIEYVLSFSLFFTLL